MTYTPPQKILERYASVLVDFALGGGEGVHPGEVVRVVAPESAKPLYVELQKAVWRAGGHVIGSYQPDDDHSFNLSRDFYELASDEQLERFPAKYMRGGEALRPLLDGRGEKENAGRFTWTLGLYGTAAMAAEADMGEEEYWVQIVHACFL